MKQSFPLGDFYNADCFDVFPSIPSGSVDFILCDLPYGTTRNKWDSVLPLEPLWANYWRVLKNDGAIVLTSAQPFTSVLVNSQLKFFKYEWIWQKEAGTGLLNAKKQPLRDHESVLVFYRKPVHYEPQFTEGKAYKTKKGGDTANYNKSGIVVTENSGFRYPKTVLQFSRDKGKQHPTQKPVALFRYMIRTYSRPGEVILDNTAGSGTTAVAALAENRRWVCIEKDAAYFDIGIERIKAAGGDWKWA